MVNEKPAETQATAVPAAVVLPDPFGHIPSKSRAKPYKANRRYMKQYGWKMDHEHCRKTVTGENIEPLDLYALTQSFKDQCGLELMKQLLASGQASPEDFADDGTLGGDNTLPRDINTLHAVVAEETAAANSIIKGLGGSSADFQQAVKDGKLEQYINGLVMKAVQAQTQKPTSEAETK